jgi:hypothetical protein
MGAPPSGTTPRVSADVKERGSGTASGSDRSSTSARRDYRQEFEAKAAGTFIVSPPKTRSASRRRPVRSDRPHAYRKKSRPVLRHGLVTATVDERNALPAQVLELVCS